MESANEYIARNKKRYQHRQKKDRHADIIIPNVVYLYILFVILTAISPLRSVVLGGIPFWHDIGRDLLLAWDNLHKITLIGPPGGIPGIFYGPYWIWLLSLPIVFTRDPRLVTIFAITLPYFVIFPLLLWKMRPIFGTVVIFTLWALFIFSFEAYATFLWSPYPAALIFLLLAYLVRQNKHPIIIGIVSGLVYNFNFSFGITVILATTIYQLLFNRRFFLRYLLGLFLVFSPVILFELRHGFTQTRAFSDTFIKSALYNSAVVGQVGIPKDEILSKIFAAGGSIFRLSESLSIRLGFLLAIWVVWQKLFKDRLMVFLLICLFALLAIYLSTKNPIWPYHFIGVETIFLLIFGLALTKSRLLKIAAGIFAFVLMVQSAVNFARSPFPNYLSVPSLVSKETIVRTVLADAGGDPFSVQPYSPAIYTYDYDYLFRWLGHKNQPSKVTYLIIPETDESHRLDFIHYKTPEASFLTIWEKTMPDGTVVLKRSQKS